MKLKILCKNNHKINKSYNYKETNALILFTYITEQHDNFIVLLRIALFTLRFYNLEKRN